MAQNSLAAQQKRQYRIRTGKGRQDRAVTRGRQRRRHARIRRARRDDDTASAETRATRVEKDQTTLRRSEGRRSALLQKERLLSDHARRRVQRRRAEEVSRSGGQFVQSVRRSEADLPRVLCRSELVVARMGPPGFRGRRKTLRSRSLAAPCRSEEHTSELQSRLHLVCRLLLEKKKKKKIKLKNKNVYK